MSRPLPPGPRDPFLGLSEVIKVRRDVLVWLRDLHRRYGDTVFVRFGPYRYYLFFHPEQVREVLVTRADAFRMSRRVRKVLAQWNGEGLVVSEGSAWEYGRGVILEGLGEGPPGRHETHVIGAARDLGERWRERAERAGGTAEVDLEPELTALTVEIAGRSLFGADLTAESAELTRAVAVLAATAQREVVIPWALPDWLPLPAKRAKRWAMARLDRTIRGLVRARLAGPAETDDLLSALLRQVTDPKREQGEERWSEERVRDHAMTMFLAGHDTTAAGLIWVLYNLARHPEVATRVAAEAAALGDGSDGASDCARLAWTGRVVKETLRLYPPAVGVFQRETVREVEIGGHLLPRGSLVQVTSFVTHRDERWFPDPERFDPDRFSPENGPRIPHFAYFPFGGGSRACVGRSFALTEMTLVAAVLAERCEISLPPGTGEPSVKAGMSLRPAGRLRVLVRPR